MSVDETVLARVGDHYLYESDVVKSIPDGILARDSLAMAQSLINKWIEKEIVVQVAEEQLPSKMLDFKEELENYRNSLVIYQYESEIVRQSVDTVVGFEEIDSYYNANKKNFILEEDIAKLQYIVMPRNFEKKKEAKKLLFEEATTFDAKAFCAQYELRCSLDEKWMYLSKIRQVLPIDFMTVDSFTHDKLELTDGQGRLFLIKVTGVRPKQDIKPLALVKNDIKNILINKRKRAIIKKLHADLVKAGFESNDIEIY
jgi:hypothetical protein